MYDVDVNGTHNVLEAAAEAGIGQVLVTTSAVAYGAFPDNPDPITEDHPVRGVARFSYARDKTESDRIVQLWALQHPDVITTIVRPCIVFGPNVDNYLVRLWTKQPFTVDAGNLDGTIQFVHEDDVVDAISRLLLGRHAGQFNLSPEGLMTLRECAEALETPIRKMPFWLYQGIAQAAVAPAPLRGAARPARLRALPVDRLEREAEADARLDAEAHVPRDVRHHDASAGQAAGGGACRSGIAARRPTSPRRPWPPAPERGRGRSGSSESRPPRTFQTWAVSWTAPRPLCSPSATTLIRTITHVPRR